MLSDRVDAREAGRDEIQSAVAVSAEAALDVVHKLAADRLERVDAEGRAGAGAGRHVAVGRVALGEDAEEDVVLRADA